MKRILIILLVWVIAQPIHLYAQDKDAVIKAIIEEAQSHSELKILAHELTDVIGPRLVGTPQMKTAHDWAVKRFEAWGIEAENKQYGEWRGWERGITHIDLVHPRVVSLEGRQLAWSPPSKKKGTKAEVITLPDVNNEEEFKVWLKNVKGKFVLVSEPQITGRPDYNWEKWATEESFEKMKTERDSLTKLWRDKIGKTGFTGRTIHEPLEEAGAVGLIQSQWSRGFGVNKVFGARTKKIPVIDLSLEDYGMLYRMAENGVKPQVNVLAQSKDLGKVPTFNTIATIPGTENPDEYIVLSAHFDSWDGGTGATDNGTGSITMMETARILKKVYPNPKRTIIIGLWGSEEQGLNGSRGFVEDNPTVVENLQALFNQDNGTGRVENISGQGFLHSYAYLGRWLEAVPRDIKQHIETNFPGTPSGGGTDNASFVAMGAPAFSLFSLSWDYWNYTWHTNRDTYDKIVFDDVTNNVILTAILTYMASEDPERTSREKAILPLNPRTGEQMTWPEPRKSNRDGGN